MKLIQRLVTIMLFLNLGFTLGADALSTDFHIPVNGQEVSTQHILGSADCNHTTHPQKDCFDPCHIGGSHFGHCSIVFKNFESAFALPVQEQVLRVNRELMIEEPFLEGHRRPPKSA